MSKPSKRERREARKLLAKPPGLQGTHAGTCAVCIEPTDSGVAISGESEVHYAFLSVMGVPKGQARIMVEDFTGADRGKAVVGVHTITYQLCADCGHKAKVEVGLVRPGGDVPHYGMGGGDSDHAESP